MTREEILAMKPGRELDELIVEKVMGWEKVDEGRMSEPLFTWYSTKNGVRFDVTAKAWTFSPSTNISAAWEVVERIKQEMQDVNIHDDPYQGCTVTISLICVAKAPTAPHAICIAALLAVMEE